MPERQSHARRFAAFVAFVVGLLVAGPALAEPYIAVETGLRCAQCHVNRTGGGLRTPVGNRFAQTMLAAKAWPWGDDGSAWLGRIGPHVGIGANLRAAVISDDDATGRRRTDDFDLREARAYLELRAIPDRLSLYVDEYLGPGGAANREAFVLYTAADASHHVKAGRMYLPFGWRLQDGSALVRSETAIDMAGPDIGVEVGWDPGPWSLQVALSEGTFGASDTDSGTLVSVQLAWVGPGWRAGVAANRNDRSGGDRSAVGVFGGLRAGPVAALAEVAAVDDRTGGGTEKSTAWLLEANVRIAAGHLLKATAEGIDPERSVERQGRLSLVYEFTPVGIAQLRAGVRAYDAPAASPLHGRRVGFVELHVFF